MEPAHRQHTKGYDYRQKGVYLITIVTKDRQRLFGTLGTDPRNPSVLLTKLGQQIEQEWLRTEDIQRGRGRKIRLLQHSVMPDHFHGVIEVEEEMDVSIGQVIRDFKSACTVAYRRLYQPNSLQPSLAEVRDMSHKQREAYYAERGISSLFEDNYDDTICLDERHKAAAMRYVQDNPRRAIMRTTRPQFFERRQHVTIAGQDYSAFGNLFLLRYPWKEQVFCHRWLMIGNMRDYNNPYETTPQFRQERERWLTAAEDGAVLVTPGISKGEQRLVADCIERGFPLIHLQDKPISEYWKPEERRFALCEQGLMLILAPWWQQSEQTDQPAQNQCPANQPSLADTKEIPADSQYAKFHSMNDLAKQICADEHLTINIKLTQTIKQQ